MHRLDFQKKETYNSQNAGISIKTVVRYGAIETICSAKIDTGSEICLFEREIGEFLEIDIESGYKRRLATLTGTLYAYGHQIEMETLDLRFETFVYFAEDYFVKRNLLGRQGWLQLIKLGLSDYDQEVYISPRHDEEY